MGDWQGIFLGNTEGQNRHSSAYSLTETQGNERKIMTISIRSVACDKNNRQGIVWPTQYQTTHVTFFF